METEGQTALEEPKIYQAVDKAAAMFMYHLYLHRYRGGFDITEKYKNADDFRENCDNITGWGFWCKELKTN
jgi:hypothetical protein